MQVRTMLLAAGSAAILLGGCTIMENKNYHALESAEAPDSAFAQRLFEGYKALATDEHAEHDVRDSEYFAAKALATREQAEVEPQAIYERRLPGDTADDLKAAREDLMAALRAGAARKVTDQAAHAQVMFDCWVQEQEENTQPLDIAACRDAFAVAMDKMQTALNLVPKKMAKAPAPGGSGGAYIVFFDFNSTRLGEGAAAVLAEAAAAAAKVSGATVVIDANADRAGPKPYNRQLSEARAEAVRRALLASGMAAAAIKVQAHGETRPAIKTADGVREAGNRRVEITIRK